MSEFKLTAYELVKLVGDPFVLRAIADMHEIWATEADAAGWDEVAKHHEARKAEILTEADRIQKEWER